MKITIILFGIWGLSTIGQGWAAEVSTARVPHDNHEIGARTSEALRTGKEPLTRNTIKSGAPGLPHNQPRLLSTRSPQFQIKRAAFAASPHSALKASKAENHLESVSKLADTGKIAPKPVVGHGSASPASVGHLTATSLKHNTAALSGNTIKRRF